ncbi:hypothetical protein J1614_005634 [Plenodomus biglobosus]|nr:hypothetical protein J1614_005634 [Plenodomus biglobosus]
MNKQYDSFTDTLCKAPARQALYKKMGGTDCIPFYDFEYKKNTTTNFDLDFQRIVDGHKLPERCDYSVNQLLNQELQPGKGPRTETPESRAAAAALKEKEEEERLAAEEERLLAEEEERQRLAEEQELNEAGLNPDGAPPGTGSFGGVVGSIPISKADSAARKKRQIQSQHRNSATTLLVRREQLRAAGNHCVDRLTISHHAEHSARELCEMNNSWGPDFVAVEERLYCDMCERELYPTCEHAGQENCFDVETRKVKGRGVSERDGGPVASLDKDYVDVQVWEV